jgi:hypothetical protein
LNDNLGGIFSFREISGVRKVSIFTAIRYGHGIIKHFLSLGIRPTLYWDVSFSANASSRFISSLPIHHIGESSESCWHCISTLPLNVADKFVTVASQHRKGKSCSVQSLVNLADRKFLWILWSSIHCTDLFELWDLAFSIWR